MSESIHGEGYSAERLSPSAAEWKLEFKLEAYRRRMRRLVLPLHILFGLWVLDVAIYVWKGGRKTNSQVFRKR